MLHHTVTAYSFIPDIPCSEQILQLYADFGWSTCTSPNIHAWLGRLGWLQNGRILIRSSCVISVVQWKSSWYIRTCGHFVAWCVEYKQLPLSLCFVTDIAKLSMLCTHPYSIRLYLCTYIHTQLLVIYITSWTNYSGCAALGGVQL